MLTAQSPQSLSPAVSPSMVSAAASEARVCVVIPTLNNARTIGLVVREARHRVPDVIVINDGSTDETAGILKGIEGLRVLTNERNMGKGAALSRGLAYAAELGFTHAITMDGDGQHSASDLPRHLEAISTHPEALIIGVRTLGHGGRALKSRILRLHSNFWVWVETGQWLADTQSGFRTYPLAQMRVLRLKTRKYDFEIESLVKAIWMGTKAVGVDVSVSYGVGSKSHFRCLRDFALVSHVNGCLVLQRLFVPLPLLRAWHRNDGATRPRLGACLKGILFFESQTPGAIAVCLGLGASIGILPIWGFQTIAAAGVAHRLRLSKPLTVAASNISFPIAIPFIVSLSVAIGELLVAGRWTGLSLAHGASATLVRSLASYLVGATVLAAITGAVVAGVSYLAARLLMSPRTDSCTGKEAA